MGISNPGTRPRYQVSVYKTIGPLVSDKPLQRRERNKNTEHLPATFALNRMLTRYNFGAARDPEMLHKIYNAEPVAPIIEIPRRDVLT